MRSSQALEILRRGFGRGVFPHQLTWVLHLPGRGLIMSAKTVADRLPIEPSSRVLEVGPGSGFYSVEVGRRLTAGELTLVDVQPEMLEKAARRLLDAGVTNHRAVLSGGGTLPFEDGAFDVIFMVTVFGEIEAQDAFLAEAARVLRPGGVLSITEHHPDPDFEPAAAVAARLERHGFAPEAPVGWRWAYTLSARKAGGLR